MKRQLSSEDLPPSKRQCLELPPELWLCVLQWLNPQQLYRTVAPVCKAWHQLSRDPSLWRELSFRGPAVATVPVCRLLQHSPRLRALELVERIDAGAILDQLQRSNKQIKVLVIKRCRGSERRNTIAADTLINVIKHCSLIVQLTIKDTQFRSAKFFRLLGTALPRLRRVNFCYNAQFGSSALNSIASACNPLEELSGFRSFGFPSSLPHCHDEDVKILSTRMASTLTVLKLNASELTDGAMEAIVSCHHLQTLYLRYAIHITFVGIMKLARLENLTSLDVSMVRLVPTQSWCDLFNEAKWDHLKLLGLSLCSHIDDEVLTCISRKYCNLEKLRLSGCIRVTDDGLSRIITRCDKLRHLNVFFTQIYTVRSFTLIPDCIPNLKTLVFRPFAFEEESQILHLLKQRLPQLKVYEIDESKRDAYWRNLNYC